jgi:hypothetical protein
MPKYLVRVQCDYSAEEGYEVEANSEAEALERVKAGDVEPDHLEYQCDTAHYETAEILEITEEEPSGD